MIRSAALSRELPRDGALVRAALEDLAWLRSARASIAYLRRLARVVNESPADAGRPPVLILQQGKVGSISVLDGLRFAGRQRIVQLHHVGKDAPRWMREAADRGLRLPDRPGRSAAALNWASERLVRVRYGGYLLRNAGRHAPLVVVVIREPIARSLSLCYHALRPVLETLPEKERLPRLVAAFERHFWLWVDGTPWEVPAFLDQPGFDGSQRSWYVRELAGVLGTDLFASGLDLLPGYAITSVGPIRVLFVRTERLGDVLPEALRSSLGIEIGRVCLSNASTEELYQRFTRAVTIPDALLDRVLATPWVEAALGDDEREQVRRRWAGWQRTRRRP